jgi:non-ribosomal peptide synthetase component F
MGILIRELAAMYGAFAADQPAPLPPLPIQFADYAHWQRNWSREPTLRAQLAFWKRQLQGPLRPLVLPTDRPRRRNLPPATVRHQVALPGPLSEALIALSQREGTTLFMTVVSAVKILLYGLTGQEDVRVATMLANRQRPETEGMIGLLANLAVLRTRLGGNPTCREILQRVRAAILDAYDHQEFPFEELARTLERERGLARASLSPVMIIWHQAIGLPAPSGASPLSVLEMDQSGLAPESPVTTFDLVLELRECSDGLTGSYLYNALLFDAATVRRLLAGLEHVLETIAVRPAERLATFRGLGTSGRTETEKDVTRD